MAQIEIAERTARRKTLNELAKTIKREGFAPGFTREHVTEHAEAIATALGTSPTSLLCDMGEYEETEDDLLTQKILGDIKIALRRLSLANKVASNHCARSALDAFPCTWIEGAHHFDIRSFVQTGIRRDDLLVFQVDDRDLAFPAAVFLDIVRIYKDVKSSIEAGVLYLRWARGRLRIISRPNKQTSRAKYKRFLPVTLAVRP